jgi:hypothetical protein
LKLPDGKGSYLDYGFNSIVPVLLPNGKIALVKMCAPSVQSISNTGLITIVFSKPVEKIPTEVIDQIIQSGII